MNQDPTRLCHESSDLAGALRDAQHDGLSPEAVDRVRTKLAAAGVVAAAGAAASTAVVTSKLSILAKLAGVGVLGVGILMFAVAIERRGEHEPKGASIASIASIASPITVGAPPPPTETPAALIAEASASADISPTTPKAEPTAAISAHAHPATAHAAPSAREGLLLLQARQALDTDPARALSLVRQHEREFPQSQLAGDRARIAALAARRLAR
jgi:hypothetical protein